MATCCRKPVGHVSSHVSRGTVMEQKREADFDQIGKMSYTIRQIECVNSHEKDCS